MQTSKNAPGYAVIIRDGQTVQTHNAVNIPASGFSNGEWIDTKGYSEVGITMLNDASTSSQVFVDYSNDESAVKSKHGTTTVLSSATGRERAAVTSTSARFMRLNLNNADTASHFMSAWVWLR